MFALRYAYDSTYVASVYMIHEYRISEFRNDTANITELRREWERDARYQLCILFFCQNWQDDMRSNVWSLGIFHFHMKGPGFDSYSYLYST